MKFIKAYIKKISLITRINNELSNAIGMMWWKRSSELSKRLKRVNNIKVYKFISKFKDERLKKHECLNRIKLPVMRLVLIDNTQYEVYVVDFYDGYVKVIAKDREMKIKVSEIMYIANV